jgi:hypothetical protein
MIHVLKKERKTGKSETSRKREKISGVKLAPLPSNYGRRKQLRCSS